MGQGEWGGEVAAVLHCSQTVKEGSARVPQALPVPDLSSAEVSYGSAIFTEGLGRSAAMCSNSSLVQTTWGRANCAVLERVCPLGCLSMQTCTRFGSVLTMRLASAGVACFVYSR